MLSRAGRWIVILFEGMILAILILAAAYVSIGRILVTNVGEFRSMIEARLSSALHVNVHIGKLAGGWTYLDPKFTIDDLIIGGAADPAVKISHVLARIDTLASIRARNIVVRNLDLAGLDLTITQNKAGGWQIKGLPRGNGTAFNPDPLLDSVRYLHGVRLSHVQIGIDTHHHRYVISNQAGQPLQLVRNGMQKIFDMPLSLSERNGKHLSRFELLGRYQGDPRDVKSFTANAYLRMPQIDVTDFLPDTPGETRLDRVLVGGQLWLDYDEDQFELRGLPVISEVRVLHGNKPITLVQDLSATIAAGTWTPGEWQFHLADIKARLGGVNWQAKTIDIALQGTPDGLSWAARLPDLDVSQIARMVTNVGESGLLTAQNLAALKAIHPGGRLADILVTDQPGGQVSGPEVTARIIDAHISAYEHSPEITAINGFVSLSPNRGFVDIVNKKPFRIASKMFPEPWLLDSAAARLNYERRPGYVGMTSGLVRLSLGDMKANARIHISLPANPAMRTWGLEIGLLNTKVLDVHKYLPVTISENLKTWLNRALKGGEIFEAGLLFHGTLGPDPEDTKIYDLYVKVRHATLDFDPHWPPVDNLSTTAYVGNWGVATDDAQGRLFDIALTDGHIAMLAHGDKPPDAILIDADLKGALADGLKILTQTPVADATNNMAKGWTGSGEVSGSLKLNVPVGDRTGSPADVDAAINLTDSDITMADYDLAVLDLAGRLNYQTKAGLSAPKLRAKLFDQPVSASIQTDKNKAGRAIDVRVAGAIKMQALYKWSGQTLLSRMKGTAGYTALLHIPVGTEAAEHPGYVEARSNLKGVAIDLPPPMGKPADTEKSLVYRQSFLKPGYLIALQLGKQTRASLKTSAGQIEGGRVNFGASPLGQVAYDKVRVTGDLDVVDYSQWAQVIRDLQSKSPVSLQSAAANTLDSIDLSVGRLEVFGLSLADVQTRITRDKAAWNVHLEDAAVSGLIKVPDDEKQPLDVALDYFHYKSSKGKQGGDPLSGVQPSGFVPINFTTKQLSLNGDDYGQWSFKFRPDKDGAMFNDVTAEVKGLSIQSGSRVAWTVANDSAHSTFKGDIKVANLGNVLKEWGYASSIQGKDFDFNVDVTWPGSPAMVSIDSLKGMVTLTQGQGRFIQADAGGGALKLLGIFDFASLAKRFRFDFSDIVDTGFSFSKMAGSVRLDHGEVHIVKPIVIRGSSSTIKLGGAVDLVSGKLDSDMVVTLPVARNLPWYAAYSAIVTGPLVGAGVWIAQKIFSNQIDQMSSLKYHISGDVNDPVIEFESIFDNKVRESAAEPESLSPKSVTSPAAPPATAPPATAPPTTASPTTASPTTASPTTAQPTAPHPTKPKPGASRPPTAQPMTPPAVAPEPAVPESAPPTLTVPQPTTPRPTTPRPTTPRPTTPQPATPQPATPQ